MDRGFGNNSEVASTPASRAPGQLPPPSVPAAPTTGVAQPARHFAPPVPSNVAAVNVVAAGPGVAGPSGDMGAHQAKRSRRPVVIALVGLGALLAVAVVLVGMLQGGGRDASPQPRLPRDPTRQYSADIGAADGLEDASVTGTSSRIAIALDRTEHDELRVFDQNGAELWQHRFDGTLEVFAAGDDFLAVENFEEGGGRIALLAGRTGDERWANDIDWYHKVVVVDGSVLVSHAEQIELFALSDGKRLATVAMDSVSNEYVDMKSSLAASGQFAVWVDAEVRVYDHQLQQVGATIPVAGGNATSVLGETVLVAADGELDRYGTDGELQASDLFEVEWLTPLEGSTWLYDGIGECGAFEFSGEAVEVLWTIDSCQFNEYARYGNGKSYAVVWDEETTDDRWIDVSNGDVLRSTRGYLQLTADGVFETNKDRFEAFQIDGGTRIYSQPRSGDQYMFLVDDALVMIDVGGTTAELTVFK